MRKAYLLLIALAILTGCHKKEGFTIKGHIDGLDSTVTIYLEQLTLPMPTMLDSAKVKPHKGTVSFSSARPTYPELYQLRMGRQRFIFSVDSTENILFSAKADSLFCPHSIEGSQNTEQIQFLRRSVRRLDSIAGAATKNRSQRGTLETALLAHKDTVSKIIYANPRSIVAYYALFQQVNGYYIFSPYDKSDRGLCAAVATAYHAFMPDYYRSTNIYNLVLEAIESQRKEDSNARMREFISSSGSGYIDIALKDNKGVERRLSDYEGKPVLLDFTVLGAEGSAEHTLALREIQEKYGEKNGLVIYQVSLDKSAIIWESAAEALPWISVRDTDGRYAHLYNITEVPTSFLIDKSGDIVGRDLKARDIESKLNPTR